MNQSNSIVFHYVSIKSVLLYPEYKELLYQHSTMYLLNRELQQHRHKRDDHLHSTVYLLNPCQRNR